MDVSGSVRLINSTFVWDISSFPDKCKSKGEYIESPSFTAGNKREYIESPSFTAGSKPSNEIKWHIRLYPFGDISAKESFLSVYLNCTLCRGISELEVSYKLYLWNGKEINSETLTSCKFNKQNCGWGSKNFLNRDGDELKKHLSLSTNSTLSIACSIASSHYFGSLNLKEELIKDFNSFFLSDNLSDVTIIINKKKLKAHKIILSSSSEVFKAMFNYDMIESNENVINVSDISYDVMKEVLRFIYCGKVENIELFTEDLLVAADKYNITSLKRICEVNLLIKLNVSNACKILSISHLYHCTELKEKTIAFIIKNMKAIVHTDEFNKIKDSNLLGDILRKISP